MAKDENKRPTGSLLSKGEPAIETPLGQAYATAKAGMSGEAIQDPVKIKVPLQQKGAKVKVQQTKDNELFKIELKNGLRGGKQYVTDNTQLAFRHNQIYNSLREIVNDRAPVLMEGFEAGQYIKNCLEAIKYDPSLGLTTIKYCTLYLERIYEDICHHLDNPEAGYTIDRPDLIGAPAPQELDRQTQLRRRVAQIRQDHEAKGIKHTESGEDM